METSDFITEQRRRKRLHNRLLGLVLGANLVGALLNVIFFSFRHSLPTDVSTGNLVVNNGLLIGTLIALGSWLGGRLTRPLEAWYMTPTAVPAAPEIQRLALNYPLILGLVSWVMWFLAGLLNALVVEQSVPFMLLDIVGMAGIAGPMTALLIYFAVERLWTPELPLFFLHTEPADVRAFRFSIRRRLFMPSLLGLVFMVVMTVNIVTRLYAFPQLSAASQILQMRIMLYQQLYLLGVAFLAAVLLTLTLGGYIAGAVETLQQHMAAVQAGRLEMTLPSTSNDEFGALAAGFNAMVRGLRQEEILHQLFNLYVTPEVAAHALAHGAELGGHMVEVTVLFADIRGFTTLTEQLGAETVIALLNRYFEAMAAVIIAESGMVNKFGGDSLLAVFGTPVNPVEDHAARAISAARGMLMALETFNADQQSRGEPALRIGIGIATGPVIAGNVGSAERLEYTVIGDTVNLASRLQELTKTLGVGILLAEATARAASPSNVRSLAPLAIRGKSERLTVYTLTDLAAEPAMVPHNPVPE